jgi:hypothetical protein
MLLPRKGNGKVDRESQYREINNNCYLLKNYENTILFKENNFSFLPTPKQQYQLLCLGIIW